MGNDSKLAAKIVQMLFKGSGMDVLQRITPAEAIKQGMQIDKAVYPWLAYTGQRFNPTLMQACMTDTEATLIDHIFQVFDVEDQDKIVGLIQEVEQFALDIQGAAPRRAVLLFRTLLLMERMLSANEIMALANESLESEIAKYEQDGSAAVH